ncbi:hypothetical protein [Elioraea rosea]|uniref:hypothetical protein n=1 Tax=Elioraea rosea TaxID=2492390 RepID=UPI001181EEB3|nr:hypothetical protein [Elioraea rosea]
MSSIAVIPPGFTAVMVAAATALVLLAVLAVQRLRGRPLRGPLAALLATLLLLGCILAGDQWRFRVEGLRAALVLADAWAAVWPPLAAAIWWLGRRR